MASIAPPAHTRREGVTTDSWITPKWLIDRLAPFDLDPCACDPMPWQTAERMLTEREDGLLSTWGGPYGATRHMGGLWAIGSTEWRCTGTASP